MPTSACSKSAKALNYNTVAERVNGIIKNELLMGMTFYSIGEVKKAVAAAVDFYNNERPHMSLDLEDTCRGRLMHGRVEEKMGQPKRKLHKTCGCIAENM